MYIKILIHYYKYYFSPGVTICKYNQFMSINNQAVTSWIYIKNNFYIE
jgi:hypothetical protein